MQQDNQQVLERKWVEQRKRYLQQLDEEFARICGEEQAQYFHAIRDEGLMLAIIARHKK